MIDLNFKKYSCSITSEFSFNTKEEALNRSKSLMHNKWKQMQEAYYKELAGVITKYDNVFLFGLTKAKIELYKYLNKDSYFRDISIAIQSTDKITENEKEAFVVNHFENI